VLKDDVHLSSVAVGAPVVDTSVKLAPVLMAEQVSGRAIGSHQSRVASNPALAVIVRSNKAQCHHCQGNS